MEEGGRHDAIPPAGAGLVRDHIYITEGNEQRTICVSATIPPDMMRTTPWRVEDFELHKELYRGKTSLLYQATDRKSGTIIALKLYRKRKLSTLNRYQVEREIRIHISLQHENIIRLHVAFEDEKNVYMVQEFATGGDLFEDLKKGGGQMKEGPTASTILIPFLSSLAYLHGMGVVHRDIKPENILLTGAKVLKVADFGLSINVRQERPVTRAGTLDYMAPEVLVCPDKRRPEENKDKLLLAYTAQVDSWAVGILAYELLVGYPPFEQESRAATYEHIMYKEPKFPSWMSDDARNFISSALCKTAAQRPSVYDLAQHAWLVGQTEDAGASPPSSASASTTQPHASPEKSGGHSNKDFPDAAPLIPHSSPHPSSHPSSKPHHKSTSHHHDSSSAAGGADSNSSHSVLPSLSTSHHATQQQSHPEQLQQQDQHGFSGPAAMEPWGMPSPQKAAVDSPSAASQAGKIQTAGGSGAYTHSHNPDPTASPFTSSPSPSAHQAPSSPTVEKLSSSQRLIAASGDSFGSATSATGWSQQQHPADRDPRLQSNDTLHSSASGSGTTLGNATHRANPSLGATLKLPALPGTPRTHSEKALNVMGHNGGSRDLTTPQPRGVLSDDTSLGIRASFSLSLEINKLSSGLGSLPGLGPPSPSGLGGGSVTGRNPLLKNMTRLDSNVSLSGTCEVLEAGNGGYEGGGAGGYGHSYFEEGGSSFAGGGIDKGSPSTSSAASQAEQQGKQSKYARLFGKLWGGGGKEPTSGTESPDGSAPEKPVTRQVSVSSRSFGAAASNLNRAASLSMTQRSGAAVGPSRGKMMNGGVGGGLDAMPAREGSYTIKSSGGGEGQLSAGGINGYNKQAGAASRRGVLDESLIAVGRIHSQTEGASRLYSTSGSMRVPGGANPSGKKAVQAPLNSRLPS